MKTRKIFVIATVAIASAALMGCGGSKQLATTAKTQTGGNPFTDVYEAPCADKDTEAYFVGLGIASGSRNRMGELQEAALTSAQNIARQKMQHAYKGAIDDYSSYMGNNMGSDAQRKVERGGSQLIDRIVNDTHAECGPKFSGVDERGEVTCYIGIRISKQQLAQAIANHLSKDEELKIRYNEQEFRKRMDQNFKNFKEGK